MWLRRLCSERCCSSSCCSWSCGRWWAEESSGRAGRARVDERARPWRKEIKKLDRSGESKMSGQNDSPYYFVPHPSRHPIMAATGLLVALGSLASWVNGHSWAPFTTLLGVLFVLFVLWHWFGDAISESEGGMYGKRVDTSYRWSMSWFIFSEVMFFAAFFGALFYARAIAMHELSSLDYKLIWPDFTAVWPNNGPAALVPHFRAMVPWPLPTINTALLLSSGATLTVAHHALREDHRKKAIIWLGAT